MNIKNYVCGTFIAIITMHALAAESLRQESITPKSNDTFQSEITAHASHELRQYNALKKCLENLKKCLMSTIDELYPHFSYWKQVFYISTNSSEQEQARQHYRAFEQEIAHHAAYLGYAHHLIYQQNHATTQQLYEFIYACLHFHSSNMLGVITPRKLASPELIDNLLLRSKRDLKNYPIMVHARMSLRVCP